MAEASADPEEISEEKPKGSSKGLFVALAGALVAGGIGFFASFAGFLDSVTGSGGDSVDARDMAKNYSFVPLDTMIVSLGPNARAQNLKFTAQLEVEPGAEAMTEELKPRILDVLNSFLRAVDESELQDPASLALLRAQMLRRIQIVVGNDIVRDLLIVEFILN